MKTTYFKMSVLAYIITAGMISCTSAASQLGEEQGFVQEKVDESTTEFNQTRIFSSNVFVKYKIESETKLEANEKKISDLMAKASAQDKALRDNNEKKLNELQLMNNKLKENMENYKEGNNTDWKKFRTEFNHDIDELGKAISNIKFKN